MNATETKTMTETNNTEPTVYEIPADRMSKLDKRIARETRRAAKNGRTPITYELVGERHEDELSVHGLPTGRVFVFKRVVLHGEAPVVAGYTFIARTEHLKAGNVVTYAPNVGDELPAELRDGGSYCDHCAKRRYRKDTFILRAESGELIRVGRNCLRDFLAGDDPADALSIWSVIRDVQALTARDEDGGYGYGYGSGSAAILSHHFIAATFRAIQLDGWVSRKRSRETGECATADQAFKACCPPPMSNKWGERDDWEKAQPNERNRGDAAAAMAWARSLEGSNDYENNIKVLAWEEVVTPKNIGLIASIASSYSRHLDREIERKRREEAREEDAKVSQHFGVVGERYVRRLTVRQTRELSSDWGLTVLYSLVDDEGNVFKWFSSGWASIDGDWSKHLEDVDTTVWIDFKIKKHGEFKGVAETQITRGRVSTTEPSNKWVGSDGRIFKTKKALRAAETTEAA